MQISTSSNLRLMVSEVDRLDNGKCSPLRQVLLAREGLLLRFSPHVTHIEDLLRSSLNCRPQASQ